MKMNCDNNMETVYIIMVHFFCIKSLKVPRSINTYGRADSNFYNDLGLLLSSFSKAHELVKKKARKNLT